MHFRKNHPTAVTARPENTYRHLSTNDRHSFNHVLTGEYGTLFYQQDNLHSFIFSTYYCLINHAAVVPGLFLQGVPFLFFNLKQDVALETAAGHEVLHEYGFNVFSVPGDTGCLEFRQPGSYTFFTLHLPVDKAKEYLRPASLPASFVQALQSGQTARLLSSSCAATPEIRQQVSDLLYSSTEGEAYYTFLEEQLDVFLKMTFEQLLAAYPGDRSLSAADAAAIYVIKSTLQSNLHTTYTLKDLSHLTHLSAAKIKAGFQQVYGMPYTDYHFRLRMEHALLLVTETDFSYREIAAAVGYSSLPTFYKQFRKYFGKTPKGYRDGSGKLIS